MTFIPGAMLLGLLLAATTVAAQPTREPAPMSKPDPTALHALASTGVLRAAINFGNPVLAQRGADGQPGGVSVALATELAKRLGVTLAIVPFEQAGKVTDALASGVWDICFLAQDPGRGQGIGFTAPYVLIEGGYAVADSAPYQTVEAVDAAGVDVAVVKGSAYDLYLTRALKHATLVRYPNNKEAADAFIAGKQPVLAGVKQPLVALVAANPGHRMIPGRFMSIEQTMGTPKDRAPAGLAVLQGFISEMKASGFVQAALTKSGQGDAEVAP
jgi:polar amino acid transport system substrate-binding protein